MKKRISIFITCVIFATLVFNIRGMDFVLRNRLPSETEAAAVQALEEPTVDAKAETGLSNGDIELIALVTMAEAEGESDEGKRLVIDTILNRVEHERFPDTVRDVIYQPNQFTSMWNGRVGRCEVKADICRLVIEETLSRTNSACVFFTAGGYGKYGTPMFHIGNHYFSKYK
jgi:N-acetylmuramoyl-L-alanine amidase